MLVRDRPELEVFMLRRTPGAVFGPGATVFPGGAVDPADAEMPGVVGLDDATASAEHGLARGGLAFRVAAVRECFEEAGVLLARHTQSRAHASSFPEWRDALNAGHVTFGHVLESEGLTIDGRDLRLFSHWLTPIGAPRRYNTWFFVARAPEGHVGVHDDIELVSSGWDTPFEVLARHDRGEIDLILPTQRSLEVLARFPTTDALFDALDAVPRDAAGRPQVIPDVSGERVALLEDDPLRGTSWTIPLPDLHHRDEARLFLDLIEGGAR
jgi:8-oxo-dGTP pyrophosphatase MutT (NUDIX family)